MSNFLSSFLNKRLNFTHLFRPRHCTLCLAACEGNLCDACQDSLPHWITDHCPGCLLPSKDSRLCGACLTAPPAWDRAVAALQYAFPVDALIRTLKYRGDLSLTPILAELLLPKLLAFPLPDCIIPVPLHTNKLKERGFNQTAEIGRQLSRRMGIPLLPQVCVRNKDTPSQTTLPWKKRHSNVRHAFTCTTCLERQHVALLDDVMTSGATLHELAKTIRQQGASEISIWVIARALPSPALHGAVAHPPLS